MKKNETREDLTKQLTVEEIKYLKRYNWVRLVKLIGFKLPIIFLIVLSSPLVYLVFFSLSDGLLDAKTSPLMDFVLSYGVPTVLILIAGIIIWKKSAKPKWWLSTKNLEAITITGTINTSDSLGNTTQWFINNTGIIMPDHWGKYIFPPQEEQLPQHWKNNRNGVFPNVAHFTVRAVKRPDATGKVSKYVFQNEEARNSSSPYIIFQDHQYFVLSCGELNITEEGENKLPSVRADFTWCLLGIIGLFFTLFVHIFCSIELEELNKEPYALSTKIIQSEKRLNLGNPIDSNPFEYRGLPTLNNDEIYADNILVSDEEFEYVLRSFTETDRPFILTLPELTMIERVAEVMPKVSLGLKKQSPSALNEYSQALKDFANKTRDMSVNTPESKVVEQIKQAISKTYQASSSDLRQYRQDIQNRINKTRGISEKLKQHASNVLSSISDELLTLQMGTYSYTNRPYPDFMKKFIIMPIIYEPIEQNGYIQVGGDVHCSRDIFCTSSMYDQPISMNGFALVNSNKTTHDEFEIIPKYELDDLKKMKNELAKNPYMRPFYYWTQGAGAIATGMFLMMSISILSFLQASSRMKSFYKRLSNKD